MEMSFAQLTAQRRAELYDRVWAYKFWATNRGRIVYSDEGAEVWHGDIGGVQHYVQLIFKAGTLSCRILRYETDLPTYDCDMIIDGDDVRMCAHKLWVDQEEEDDSEDVSQEMKLLPVVVVDPKVHFLKPTSYKSEIRNLILAKGSPSIVDLLGRTEDGHLVFPRYSKDLLMATFEDSFRTIANYKRCLLEMLEGVEDLHSMGIVHRDLWLRNFLVGDRVVVADLQCKYGARLCLAPEVRENTNFSPASDVYALGICLWQMCYFNNPPTCMPFLDLTVPAPFDGIFKACLKDSPSERPTIPELRDMVNAISVSE